MRSRNNDARGGGDGGDCGVTLNRKFCLIVVLACSPLPSFGQGSCEVADILFGPRSLDIIQHKDENNSLDYETAIVRSDTFDNPKENFGAILGEITVDRGGFAVRNNNQVVVGIITPDFVVEGWSEACSGKRKLEIVRVRPQSFILLSDSDPIGTIRGRFPKNSFGVETQ